METVTVSPKFQVTIPKLIREKLGLSPGQKVQAILYGDRIELIPVRLIKEMRGFLKGRATTVEREPGRLATAQAFEATVWTQDADFKGLPGVQFQRHKP